MWDWVRMAPGSRTLILGYRAEQRWCKALGPQSQHEDLGRCGTGSWGPTLVHWGPAEPVLGLIRVHGPDLCVQDLIPSMDQPHTAHLPDRAKRLSITDLDCSKYGLKPSSSEQELFSYVPATASVLQFCTADTKSLLYFGMENILSWLGCIPNERQ